MSGLLNNLTNIQQSGIANAGGMLGQAITNVDAADGSVNPGAQAIGSALSFAGMGFSIGGPIGAVGGAILGGIMGLVKGNKMKQQQEHQKAIQQWNASVQSKPNPSASDVSASQYGQKSSGLQGISATYLNNKFGIDDSSIMGKMMTINN